MKRLTYTPDQNSMVGNLNSSDTVENQVLAANVAETIAVPAGSRFVRLIGTAQFYYNVNATATVPAADNAAGNGSVVAGLGTPHLFFCGDLASISVIASGVAVISAEFWA